MTTPDLNRRSPAGHLLDDHTPVRAERLGTDAQVVREHVPRAGGGRRQISASFDQASIDLLSQLAAELRWTKSDVLAAGLQHFASTIAEQRRSLGDERSDATRAAAAVAQQVGDALFARARHAESRAAVAAAFGLSASELGDQRPPSGLVGR